MLDKVLICLIKFLQGVVVIRSDTKPALDLIITRLRVILKIVWPYKHPFAALKKWPLDLINTHLRSSKKKSDLITAQMRKKTFCANRIFFNQKYFLTNSLGWKSVTLNPQMRQTLFAKIVFFFLKKALLILFWPYPEIFFLIQKNRDIRSRLKVNRKKDISSRIIYKV